MTDARRRTGARRRVSALAGATAAGALVVGGGWAGPAHAAPNCVPAGKSGLTAAMVATSGQTLTGQTVDGTGCDIGIYLAPGTSNVTIDTDTVSGANVHGIYGQEVTGITIQNSTVQNNGLKPNPNIPEEKAIELDGVTNSTIKSNTVQNNVADGGIGVDDDGPNSPGAINGGSATPVRSSNVTVTGNNLPNNYGGCDIVAAAYNAGGGLDHITINGNNIPGKPGQFNPNAGPFIGQIVVANDFPGNAITNTTISNNTIVGSALAGIVLHANAPDDTESGTVITGNTISLNHWATPFGPPQLTGIAIQAEGGPPGHVAAIDNTLIQGNAITNQYYGIWTKGAVTNTGIGANDFTGATQAVFNKPDPDSGYTLVASDGGAFTYGHAVYSGSAAASHPAVKIVGAAPTRDDNGWWVAGADGSVFDVGDATAVGSLPLIHVTPKAPIVGIAATNPGGGQGPGPNGIGFYLVGSDGGVFNFGDAGYMGSLGNVHLNAPIVGMA
ncbi:MAG TPA: right-handed parallel beta-helix repeat-containing protein, partial [Acidimicrobiales bacterium]|nr:right-handed parallel beta-helix repeat-containing protein [Acidimicrobiales bacterium]